MTIKAKSINLILSKFEYSERSRSKRLVDLMASYNLYQSGEIPPVVEELLQQYEELQRQIDQERQSHKSENNRSETRAAWEAYNEAIASLETQKQQIWENLRCEDPVLAGEIYVCQIEQTNYRNRKLYSAISLFRSSLLGCFYLPRFTVIKQVLR